MIVETFNTSEVTIFTGVTKPLLERWISRGWVTPSVQQASGSETENMFSRIDLYHIGFLKKVMESGFSVEMANDKIDVFSVCKANDISSPVGIAFSRAVVDGEYETRGVWLLSPAFDKETGWDSLSLIWKRLTEGASDFYILNFTHLKEQIDAVIDEVREE